MAQTPSPVSHFILFPVLGRDACAAGAHDGWAINACQEGGHEIYAGTVDGDPTEVLHQLSQGYPEAKGKVTVRWIDEAGETRQTKPGSPEDVMDELMQVVCDQTPDDAENTDDHPLEEARTFLDELSQIRQGDPEP